MNCDLHYSLEKAMTVAIQHGKDVFFDQSIYALAVRQCLCRIQANISYDCSPLGSVIHGNPLAQCLERILQLRFTSYDQYKTVDRTIADIRFCDRETGIAVHKIGVFHAVEKITDFDFYTNEQGWNIVLDNFNGDTGVVIDLMGGTIDKALSQSFEKPGNTNVIVCANEPVNRCFTST